MEENTIENNALGQVISVSQLNNRAQQVLESSIGYVWVEGEISNFVRPASGHSYFSLKDQNAQVRCAMFRSRSIRLPFRPENGLRVIAYARVSVYAARGEFQLVVESLEPAGDGLLRLRFEQLKQKLHAEGLFDASRKQPLPQWPRAIGVVTSATGAAVRDIITVLSRRCPAIPIIIYPTLVQGDKAAEAIVNALEKADERAECDVIILGRGGGSLEDLWPFNEEPVARAIAAMRLPTVSAVGHEIDITIADLVADVRAATPSAAAELVSPDQAQTVRRLTELQRRLGNSMLARLERARALARHLARRLVSPHRRLERDAQRLDELLHRLHKALDTARERRAARLHLLQSRLKACAPGLQIQRQSRELAMLKLRLQRAWRGAHTARQTRLQHFSDVLRALGPEATLARGYSIASTANGHIIRTTADLAPGDSVSTRVAQGSFVSRVVELRNEPPDD